MQKIVVLGATGDLGFRVAKQLAQEATVVAPVRASVPVAARQRLQQVGIETEPISAWSVEALAPVFEGAETVVSTLSGLESTIVTAQTIALDAAVSAGVGKFMPSDYAVDYRHVAPGDNRNLNLREQFRGIAETRPIQLTSILNGAFMDMLSGVAPFILYRIRRILCWGDPDQRMDWTMIHDVASYTAHAALDPTTPRFLNIVGSSVSASDMAQLMSDLTGHRHRVFRPGNLAMLKALIAITRRFVPGRDAVYPPWQGMQYMHSMYQGACRLSGNDNLRYPVHFTPISTFLSKHLRGETPVYVPNSRNGLA